MTENLDDPTTPIEIVEELTEDELADLQRLERKVERAFYESGKALAEIRSRQLYRANHNSFEDYCQDRFGMKRIYAHYLINAATVVDNLSPKRSQFVNILPTNESQCRPLIPLEPEEQPQVWQEAVEQAGGKVPSARIVKDVVMRHKSIVEQLKEKHPSPPEFAEGDVVEIRATKHSPVRPFDGMWALVEHIGSYSCTVQISIAKDAQHCQEGEMKKIEDEYAGDIKAVGERIAALVQLEGV